MMSSLFCSDDKKIACEAFRNGTEAHEVSFVTIV